VPAIDTLPAIFTFGKQIRAIPGVQERKVGPSRASFKRANWTAVLPSKIFSALASAYLGIAKVCSFFSSRLKIA
jgi:hypothetical protein